jgi:hypothetical protein
MSEDTARAELDLDLLERIHAKRGCLPECGGCYREWPCDPVRLVWEVRRLRAVEDAARRLAFALDRRAGDAGGHDAADRVEYQYSNNIAWCYFTLCETLNPPAPPHVAPEAIQTPNQGRDG